MITTPTAATTHGQARPTGRQGCSVMNAPRTSSIRTGPSERQPPSKRNARASRSSPRSASGRRRARRPALRGDGAAKCLVEKGIGTFRRSSSRSAGSSDHTGLNGGRRRRIQPTGCVAPPRSSSVDQDSSDRAQLRRDVRVVRIEVMGQVQEVQRLLVLILVLTGSANQRRTSNGISFNTA